MLQGYPEGTYKIIEGDVPWAGCVQSLHRNCDSEQQPKRVESLRIAFILAFWCGQSLFHCCSRRHMRLL